MAGFSLQCTRSHGRERGGAEACAACNAVARNIERIFTEAGLPAGVFQNLIVSVEMVGRILADSRISAATVTGSPRAGAGRVTSNELAPTRAEWP